MIWPRTIRAKVAIASLLLLAVPWFGYQYVREMERFLREGLEDGVLDAARGLAATLHERPDLIPADLRSPLAADQEIYVHPLAHRVQIDGYTEEWGAYRTWLEPLHRASPGSSGPGAARAEALAGRHRGFLLVLVEVRDDDVRPANPARDASMSGDHLRLVTRSPQGGETVYLLASPVPGALPVHLGSRVGGALHALPFLESRIQAAWQPTGDGYAVEIRAPTDLVGEHLRVEVVAGDVLLTYPRPGPGALPARLVGPSPAVEGLLAGAPGQRARRIWIVDPKRRVLARGGELRWRPREDVLPGPLTAWLLGAPSERPFLDRLAPARLDGSPIVEALSGATPVIWRAAEGSRLFVVSGAAPIRQSGDIAGAVLVEETSLSVQAVRLRALARLLTGTVLALGGAALLLLLLATRITVRLRRLRAETDAAIDRHGRVVGSISASSSSDEIGDLTRSFAALTERLQGYNQYLEHLARRLSHELRTPVTIVRSSLETMVMEDPGADRSPYVQRAVDGIARLDRIIARLSESTRIEQALESTEAERFDPHAVLEAALDAHRGAWPEQAIDVRFEAPACTASGSPDLIVQMLDKLLANARDFAVPGTAIEVTTARSGPEFVLGIENRGPPLPPGDPAQLFQSMVSKRPETGAEPHLGLGLYIVSLIARHHGGSVAASNRSHGDGVRFEVRLPIQVGRTPGSGARNERS